MKALLSWIVFNTVIGNADAHAKNLAILHLEKGRNWLRFMTCFLHRFIRTWWISMQ
jgi:hypothetical protein